MKKTFYSLGLAASLAFFAACSQQKDINQELAQNTELSSSDATGEHRNCASHEVMMEQVRNNPEFGRRMSEIESFTQELISNPARRKALVNGVIEIPVVVNVLYRTSSENISLTQIQSQIDVLNEDFNATNADFNQVPSLFSNLRANIGIRFRLDQVVRKYSNRTSWQTNDAMKSASTGIAPSSPTTKLNIWVVNSLANGVLGYAQFPGGPSSTDGVVIAHRYFGRTGTVVAPFNKGRIATHEVGHWLNLRHIWGDATCGSDLVSDTPTHNAPNYGCPTFPHYSTCSGTPVEMTMNYMDYTDDACMYMFSNGQKARALAVFAAGGPHAAFAQ